MKTSHFWIGFTVLFSLVLACLAVLLRLAPIASRLDRSLDQAAARTSPTGSLKWETFNGIEAMISVPRDPKHSDDEHAARVEQVLKAFLKKFPIKEN